MVDGSAMWNRVELVVARGDDAAVIPDRSAGYQGDSTFSAHG
jgi:hypothetical protein